MQLSMEVGAEESGIWRRRLWLVGYAIGFGLLFVQTLAALVNQIAPPLPMYDSATYAFPVSEEKCAEEGGTWVSYGGDASVFPPDANGSCQGPLAREIERDAKQNKHADAQHTVYAIGGGAAIVVGLLAWHLRGLAAGLLLGGIFALYGLSNNFLTFLSNPGVAGRNESLVLAVMFLVAAYVGWRAFEAKRPL